MSARREDAGCFYGLLCVFAVICAQTQLQNYPECFMCSFMVTVTLTEAAVL